MNENYEILDDIELVSALIKKGNILVTSNGTMKTYFAQKKGKVFCQNASSSFTISFNEFKSLYNSSKFIIYEFEEGSDVDLKKDEEYYSWDVLSK